MDLMLYNAVTKGKVEILSQFGASQLEVQLTPTKNTVLHVAAQSGHLGCVEVILSKCPCLLTSTNGKGETALHIAARKGLADIVKVLIDCAKRSSSGGGAEEATKEMLLRATNEDKDTALHMAVQMPASLRNAGRDQSEVLKKHGFLEVLQRKKRRHLEVLQLKRRGYLEALQLKRRGYLEVVRTLTREDSEFQHSPNNADETPLYLAAERGHDEMVSDILEFSKNPAYTGPGRNALHAALLSDCAVDTIKKLLEWKPELIKESDDCGWTPFHCAVLKSSPEMVKLLLEKDKSTAYIGITDKDGDNKIAIHIAAYRGRRVVMEQILSQCPYCWEIVTGNKGQNILHLAMETREEDVIQFILENPSMEHLINRKDVEGNTPLHLFATWPSWRARELLGENHVRKLESDGDWNAFNNKILSPRDIAWSDKPIIQWEYWEFPSLRNIVSSEKDYITKRKKRLEKKNYPTDDPEMERIEKERVEGARKVVENHLIVAALIATVTFAAGFTLPGGYDGNRGEGQGRAVLAKVAAFKAFVISNTIAATCSTSAVFLYVMAALYGYVMGSRDARNKMVLRHSLGFYLILIAMGAMTVAFITGAFAVLAHSLGLAITVCGIASLSFLLHFFEIWNFIFRKF